jgi:hypothetical protein
MLYNADTDLPLRELTPGSVINLAQDGANLTIVVNVSCGTPFYVRFSMNGLSVKNALTAPYSIAGHSAGPDFAPWTPAVGTHTLVVTPFNSDGVAQTAWIVPFTVISEP